jgi:opacity protein-like surface antigen
MRKITGLLMCVFFACAVSSRAAGLDDIRTDSEASAKWFSEQVAHVTAFNTASTPLLPASVLKVLGVEVGVQGGASLSKIDVTKFRNLPLGAFDNKGSAINLPDTIPFPQAVVHAKVGLPMGFDVGLKYGGLNFENKTSGAKIKFENKVFGAEVRKRLLGGGVTGVMLPDVAVSLAYDNASGNITRTETYNAPLLQGYGTMNAETTWKTDWNTGAVTARAVASKKLLIITPFAGVGLSQLMGNAETTISTLGTITPAPATGATVNESVKAKGDAKKTVFHAMGGAEISLFPFMSLNLSYLWSKDDQSAQAGLRFQFR